MDSAPSLSFRATELIESDETDVSLSIASLWEISIKNARGKVHMGIGYETLPDVLTRYSIEILPIYFEHTVKQNQLPFHRKNSV